MILDIEPTSQMGIMAQEKRYQQMLIVQSSKPYHKIMKELKGLEQEYMSPLDPRRKKQ